jgi:hypothetical protein
MTPEQIAEIIRSLTGTLSGTSYEKVIYHFACAIERRTPYFDKAAFIEDCHGWQAGGEE